MGKDSEKLQFLGTFGIVSESFNILLRSPCSNLLRALTLCLLLPLSFAMLGHLFVTQPLLGKIACDKFDNPASEKTLRELWESNSRSRVFVFAPAVVFLIYALWTLSTATVVYTVASIYTADAKNRSVGRIMRMVPRVWDHLMIIYLWNYIILLALYISCGLALFLLGTFFSGAGAGYTLNSRGFFFSPILVITVFICAAVYITTVLYLSGVVSVLEQKYYGHSAMRKSKNLIKGKQMTALALVILYFIFSGGILGFFWYAVVNGRGHGVGIAARAVYGTLLVVLLCFVNLLGLLTQCVFYFVCKSYHQESIDDECCLEVYNVGDDLSLSSSALFSWKIYTPNESISIDLSIS